MSLLYSSVTVKFKTCTLNTEHDALVKSSTKIFSNFVAFSENPNFKYLIVLSSRGKKCFLKGGNLQLVNSNIN